MVKGKYNYLHFKKLDSTNLYALRELPRLPDKTIITADTQTAGRGRFGNKWVSSNPKNIYLSIVLKPQVSIERVNPEFIQYLAGITAKVLDEYLAKFQLSTALKWPNDILVEGKKIAGVLAETSVKGELVQGVILGVGVNLDLTPAEKKHIDQPATSLKELTGKLLNKKVFLDKLLTVFFKDYADFLASGIIKF